MVVRATRSSPAGVLVGRDRELAALRDAFNIAAAGRPTVALLTGEAGIGKTRLADEAALIARAAGTQVLRGEADASSHEPMELWRGIYRALGIVPVSDPSLPAEERRWEHLESLADALVSCAPVVVVLDDLHWADAMAIWVLEHLPRALGAAPIALLATSRDHEPNMPALDPLRRVSLQMRLDGLDVEGVRRLTTAETTSAAEPLDPVELHARTGGNPLFIQELMRSPESGRIVGSAVIGVVLQQSLDRFDAQCREMLTTAAVAGPDAPLSLLATACSCTTDVLAARLEPALRGGVLDEVSAAGVRFHHVLLAEAAERLADHREQNEKLSAAWQTVDSVAARAAAVRHRLRASAGTSAVTDGVAAARDVATELVAAGQQTRAAALLQEAYEAGAHSGDARELRANVALDLAELLSWHGDLDPALALYQEAAELARESSDPVTRARAEVGANLWASAFVPDLARIRRLEEALDLLPADELHLRATLLGRLTIVGSADVDATERVRAWAAEAVAVARSTGDPVLIAQALLDQTQTPTSRSEIDAVLVAADEIIPLAERAGRSDLALAGHQRRAGYYLNRGDLGAAFQSLNRAEVLAALQPSPLVALQHTAAAHHAARAERQPRRGNSLDV